MTKYYRTPEHIARIYKMDNDHNMYCWTDGEWTELNGNRAFKKTGGWTMDKLIIHSFFEIPEAEAMLEML